MEKEEFEKKKSRIVKNGLNIINRLKDTFETILKHNWYEDWEYPDEFRNLNGSKVDSVDIKFLFELIKIHANELLIFPNKLESLWKQNLK